MLAEYFSSVYTKEPDTIWELPTREQGLTTLQINLTEEIKKILAKIKIDKSPGPDAIHPRILYELREVICKPLHKIFKTSMETGKIPEEWRHANVTAIHKKGSRLIASNYRPVSLTSVVCKTMETLIRNPLVNYMKRNGYLSKQQFGFISGRSTTLQLL